MNLKISFNTLEKRHCKLTQEDKELLQKYDKMKELSPEVFEDYLYTYPKCNNCKIEINVKWTFCPSCGNDLPLTEHNKIDDCEEIKNA